MLLISEALQLKYLELNDKLKIDNTINNKIFRVADTPLSYRQANALSNDKLLPNNRDKKEGWRRFSLKELIYVYIVFELKKYGFKQAQLKYLWNCFFKEPDIQKREYQITKAVAETAVGCVFAQVEIVMTITNKGDVVFYDPVYFSKTQTESTSFILIRLNDIVNSLLKKFSKTLPVNITIADAYLHRKISPKEQQILEIVRNRSYSNIKIKKKNGEIITISAERLKTEVLSDEEILKILKERDFQDISIVKRDGVVANLTVEEVIKL